MSSSDSVATSILGDLLQPLPGKIGVLVQSREVRTASGLFIPEETARSIHEERATQGTVVCIGDEVDDVSVGDVVIFGKYTGTKIKYKPPLKDDATVAERKAHAELPTETVIIMEERSVLSILLDSSQAANLKVRG